MKTGKFTRRIVFLPDWTYPSVGPEHAYLQNIGRASYVAIDDDEAVSAFRELSALEGIIPALESAHALAYAKKLAKQDKGSFILVNLSGRGDKDLAHLTTYKSNGGD